MSDPAALAAFLGEWRVAVGDMEGRTEFAWMLGGRFLVQRTEIPGEGPPDSTAIVAADADGGGFTQHYFDSRGVVRLYAMTFAGGEWTLLRTEPDFSPLPFHQRFTGTFDADGGAIRGRWEQSPDGTAWELDFELTYTRLG